MTVVNYFDEPSQPMWKVLSLSVRFYLYHLEKLALSSQNTISLNYGYFLLVNRLGMNFPFTRNPLIDSAILNVVKGK